MHFFDHALSIVSGASIRRLSVVNLSHFRFLLWNCCTVFNETWQEAIFQSPLTRLRFSGRSKKGRPGIWLAETLSTSLLKLLKGIQRNLSGSKISTFSIKFLFFGLAGKSRWPPWPLIGWDFFNFSSEIAEWNSTKLEGSKTSTSSTKFVFFGQIGKILLRLTGWDMFVFFSETSERNSTKLDRKKDLKVLYEVCVFRAERINKMAALVSDWLRHFKLLLGNRRTEFNETWRKGRSQYPLPSTCMCLFQADRKNKMVALASDWLRRFQLLLWNFWLELNKTCQEASSQCPLPSLCFCWPIIKQNVCPCRWFAWDILNFLCFGGQQDCNPSSAWLRHFRLLLWNLWAQFNEPWQEARS